MNPTKSAVHCNHPVFGKRWMHPILFGTVLAKGPVAALDGKKDSSYVLPASYGVAASGQ
jgi:hypothetical protein